MKAFDVPFQEELIALGTPEADAKLKALSPSGRVPLLVVNNELKIWESLSICEFIAEQFPEKNVWPKEMAARAHARSISNEMHSGFSTLREELTMRIRNFFPGYDYSKAQADISRIETLWTDCMNLYKGPYLFGNFSAADAMFAPIVFRFNTYGVRVNEYASKYMKTMLNHPAMKTWYEAAKAEAFTIEKYESMRTK